jgi:hypothetical protein
MINTKRFDAVIYKDQEEQLNLNCICCGIMLDTWLSAHAEITIYYQSPRQDYGAARRAERKRSKPDGRGKRRNMIRGTDMKGKRT